MTAACRPTRRPLGTALAPPWPRVASMIWAARTRLGLAGCDNQDSPYLARRTWSGDRSAPRFPAAAVDPDAGAARPSVGAVAVPSSAVADRGPRRRWLPAPVCRWPARVPQTRAAARFLAAGVSAASSSGGRRRPWPRPSVRAAGRRAGEGVPKALRRASGKARISPSAALYSLPSRKIASTTAR